MVRLDYSNRNMKPFKGFITRKAYHKDSIKYIQLHYRIEYILGKPNVCDNENCSNINPKRYHWSNVSGKYESDYYGVNLWDWQRLCAKCHKQYDMNHKKDPTLPKIPLWWDNYIARLQILEGKRG